MCVCVFVRACAQYPNVGVYVWIVCVRLKESEDKAWTIVWVFVFFTQPKRIHHLRPLSMAKHTHTHTHTHEEVIERERMNLKEMAAIRWMKLLSCVTCETSVLNIPDENRWESNGGLLFFPCLSCHVSPSSRNIMPLSGALPSQTDIHLKTDPLVESLSSTAVWETTAWISGVHACSVYVWALRVRCVCVRVCVWELCLCKIGRASCRERV